METSVLLRLDTRRGTDKGFPIVLRIVHKRKIAQISTGIYLKKTEWNEKASAVLPSYKGTESVKRLNNLLSKKRIEVMDFILMLDEAKKLSGVDVYELKRLIDRKSEKGSFFKYAESLISEMEEANQIGNARIYSTTVSVMKGLMRGKDISFPEVTAAFLKKWEIHHLKKGGTYNGLSVYLRTIRAIYNRAIKDKLVSRDLYPFADYEIKSSRPRKRAISIEAIRRIAELDFAAGHPLFNARNYFLVSFYLRGMSFVDMAHLKVRDIIDGRIQYQRQKTDKPYTVKVTSEAKAILDHYTRGKRKDDHVFPIIHRETAKLQHKDVEWDRKEYNEKLKEIAELCDIQENLTSYVSRHSFATRAKNLGIPIANISEMLGHGDIKTTENYLDNLPTDLLDDQHEKIIR
jgi:integrase/recombinase XerD